MKTFYHKLLTAYSVILLVSCQNTSNLSSDENVAQLLIGRPYSDVRSCLGVPESQFGDKKLAKAYWTSQYEVDVPHYQSGSSHTDTRYDYWSDTLTTTTTTTPSYVYYTREKHIQSVLAEFINFKTVQIDFFTKKYPLGLPTWEENNEVFLAWNRANADDDLEAIQKLEFSQPLLRTKEYRIKGCLQAAKYNSAELLGYYLTVGGVTLNDSAETWAKGANPIGTKYVLTTASVREILQSKNDKDVREDLGKLGISF